MGVFNDDGGGVCAIMVRLAVVVALFIFDFCGFFFFCMDLAMVAIVAGGGAAAIGL